MKVKTKIIRPNLISKQIIPDKIKRISKTPVATIGSIIEICCQRGNIITISKNLLIFLTSFAKSNSKLIFILFLFAFYLILISSQYCPVFAASIDFFKKLLYFCNIKTILLCSSPNPNDKAYFAK